MSRRCDVNVLRLFSMLCSSPITAYTRGNTGRAVPGSAGTCSPACAMSASSPTALRATVLPPVFGPEITSARVGATSVVKATAADWPGRKRTRARNAIIGSSTAPVVPESAPSTSNASGSRVLLPRPRKRARSVSQVTSPTRSGPVATTCTHTSDRSFAERGRRVAVIALHHSWNSVCTNRLAKAGCARSASGGASTTSP